MTQYFRLTNSFVLLTLLLVSYSRPVFAQDVVAGVPKLARNKILELKTDHSDYHLFIPKRKPKRILVIAHGTPDAGQSTTELSLRFIKRWTEYATKNRLLLISISFNRENFASDSRKVGYGYRGLFGRVIGSDDYVIQLVEKYIPLCSVQDGRFLLYGHSAGGQFLIRFCVMHPERIAAAVASAPGRFAYPNAEVNWPNGMKPFAKKVRWNEKEVYKTVIRPSAAKFAEASKLPIVVLYGDKDIADQSKHPGHPGSTRLEFGRAWVNDMNELEGGNDPSITLKIEKGFGHSSSRATVPCQKEHKKLKWVEPPKTAIMRTWRSKSGSYRVEAKLVENNGTEVKLLTEAGKQVEVKTTVLSKTDLEFLGR